jgi:hypothetical protein
MRTSTTLPLLMGLISATLAQAQNTNPTVTPTTPSPTAPATGPAAPPAPIPAAGGSATEEASPFVFGVRQGLTGDSNLFRAPEGSPFERRDRIWSSGVHLGLDKSLGRQHFLVDLAANANRYNKNKYLNNTDYNANARWDWETIGRLSGQLSAQQRQSLYRDTIDGTISLERNQVRSTALGFQARLGLVTVWSLEAGAAASENDYRGVDVDDRDVRQSSINAGIRYRPGGALSTRLGVRRSEGRYPTVGTMPDEFTRDDVDLATTFDASGASRLNTRLSATRERHSMQGERDIRGWTGALGWRWRPTGKLTSELDLSHDRSVGRADLDSALIGAETSDAREADMASLAVTWAATAKISLVPRVSYVRRKLDNSFIVGGAPTATGTDTTGIASLALTYTPFNAFSLICQVTYEQRKVGGDAALSTPYKATVAGCNAEFALR